MINTKVEGVAAYATSDIFTPHPTKPDLWRIHGRADDQIMHNSGEKVSLVQHFCNYVSLLSNSGRQTQVL